jgi:hypothetical protein
VVNRPVLVFALLLASSAGACVVVPKTQRAHFVKMDSQRDVLRERALRKLHNTREGAAGGDGAPAGGGCSCSN